ncbi:SDR family NAD(P)-dependent oxidoreductase [Novacetimonas maltaceti]|uniref:SDR family NAD(P)-dependent oxidoreductase n=1 Tax=Novacetimonas maltaceti TaxID=1203393 RepID=UPI00142E37FC|nr:SDR family NAD(P)-dependent oxidoreductase [Novacetimonas maltaceti]
MPPAPHRHGTALVTGAGSGIGRAIAIALCNAGYHVILAGRRRVPLSALASQLGEDRTTVWPVDITQPAALPSFTDGLCSLDILVHSAGMFDSGKLADIPPDSKELLYRVNVSAPLHLSGLLLPALRKARGQIVFINSTASLGARVTQDAYAASKHALRQEVAHFRERNRGSGIRVLNVYPGRTATPMQSEVLRQEGRPDADISLLQPEDIATVILDSIAMPRRAEVTDIVIRPAEHADDSREVKDRHEWRPDAGS